MSSMTGHRIRRQSGRGLRNRKIVERIGIYIILILVALFVLMPLFWMLSTSFKPKSQ